MERREFVRVGALALADLALLRIVSADPAPRTIGGAGPAGGGFVEIRMRSDETGGRVWFDPVGLYVEPGTTVRWIVECNVHTTTAYHPRNDDHPLRIPEAAEPWDSGYLVNPGDAFEQAFEVPGVYDYYCKPHEAAGMVGRIVVGEATGPGARPFDYFREDPNPPGWRSVPSAARAVFPETGRILRDRVVRRAS